MDIQIFKLSFFHTLKITKKGLKKALFLQDMVVLNQLFMVFATSTGSFCITYFTSWGTFLFSTFFCALICCCTTCSVCTFASRTFAAFSCAIFAAILIGAFVLFAHFNALFRAFVGTTFWTIIAIILKTEC